MEDESSKNVNTEEERGAVGETPKSLEDFITEQYTQQKMDGKFDATDEIDDERTSDFFSRALEESRRMNKEVAKSQVKLDKLHNELGVDRFNEWRSEHASEVLGPEQADCIAHAGQYCAPT